MVRVRLTRAVLGALVLAGSALAVPAQSQTQGAFFLPQSIETFVCGTAEVRGLLSSQYAGIVRLNNFLVAGDHASIRFKLVGVDTAVETWARSGTAQIDGQLVSVFNPSWDSQSMATVLASNRWGWDQAYVFWGELLPGDTEPGQGLSITLRMAPDNLPQARITKLAEDVQFSSHVVNLVMPQVGNGRVTSDDHDFSATAVTKRFYEYFEDSYDVLAIVPHEIHIASTFDAFHSTVKSEVRGIGQQTYDVSSRYGSAGVLKAYEVYVESSLTVNAVAAHETAHQWGSYVDWTRLTALVRAGRQPEAHDPLWTDGEAILAGLLLPTRRVRRVDGGWKVERTPSPATFNPYTKYAMGILSKDQVPEVSLFENQDQFGGNRTPAIGTDVSGPVKTATIFNVIGMLGEREGPRPSEWRRATIVVSRSRALSQREMDYWTFYAQRVEDPNRTGVVSWDGIGSFDLATGRAIDLQTTSVRRPPRRSSNPWMSIIPTLPRRAGQACGSITPYGAGTAPMT